VAGDMMLRLDDRTKEMLRLMSAKEERSMQGWLRIRIRDWWNETASAEEKRDLDAAFAPPPPPGLQRVVLQDGGTVMKRVRPGRSAEPVVLAPPRSLPDMQVVGMMQSSFTCPNCGARSDESFGVVLTVLDKIEDPQNPGVKYEHVRCQGAENSYGIWPACGWEGLRGPM
jgi:hypothetical protein